MYILECIIYIYIYILCGNPQVYQKYCNRKLYKTKKL